MDPKIIEEIKRRNKLKMQQWEDRLKIGKIGKGHDDEPQSSSEAATAGSLNDFLDKTPEQPQAAPPVPPPQPARPVPQPSAEAEDPALARFDIGPADPSKIDLTTAAAPEASSSGMQSAAPRPAQPASAPPAAETAPPIPDNAKQLHIDIIDGKIKISRKNISMEQSLNLLAKVYNSYKKKLKK